VEEPVVRTKGREGEGPQEFTNGEPYWGRSETSGGGKKVFLGERGQTWKRKILKCRGRRRKEEKDGASSRHSAGGGERNYTPEKRKKRNGVSENLRCHRRLLKRLQDLEVVLAARASGEHKV